MKYYFNLIAVLLYSNFTFAQSYWQQEVSYTMDVALDRSNHQIEGSQKLIYTNNAPDTLHKVYYHLYFNAFQPGSMMDVRSRNIPDPDRRVGDRISKLTKETQGFQIVKSLKLNGADVDFQIEGTILKAILPEPILPGQSVVFEMTFKAQVPLQIRRSGRDNSEGIDYTMTQWYPKMAEYDRDGWHAIRILVVNFTVCGEISMCVLP